MTPTNDPQYREILGSLVRVTIGISKRIASSSFPDDNGCASTAWLLTGQTTVVIKPIGLLSL